MWDIQTQNDNSSATENELVMGSDGLHDLGGPPLPDQDWYALSQTLLVIRGHRGTRRPVTSGRPWRWMR
jgi:hypothetical protein